MKELLDSMTIDEVIDITSLLEQGSDDVLSKTLTRSLAIPDWQHFSQKVEQYYDGENFVWC